MYDGQLFPRIINDTNNSLDIYTYKSNNTVRATIIKTIRYNTIANLHNVHKRR